MHSRNPEIACQSRDCAENSEGLAQSRDCARHLCNLEIAHAESANFMGACSSSWLSLLRSLLSLAERQYSSHERSTTILTKPSSTVAYRGPGTKL